MQYKYTGKSSKVELEQPLILVGFGKYSLEEVMSWVGTEKEDDVLFAPKKWPPRYRRPEICENKDLDLFQKYTLYVCSLMAQLEKE
jgi:hypothetical protein